MVFLFKNLGPWEELKKLAHANLLEDLAKRAHLAARPGASFGGCRLCTHCEVASLDIDTR